MRGGRRAEKLILSVSQERNRVHTGILSLFDWFGLIEGATLIWIDSQQSVDETECQTDCCMPVQNSHPGQQIEQHQSCVRVRKRGMI